MHVDSKFTCIERHAMKHPTLRKLRNRGLTPIRYYTPLPHAQFKHGWIVKRGARGALTIRLVGEDRNRKLSVEESATVRPLA